MLNATEAGKDALASFAEATIKKSQTLYQLSLSSSNFSSSAIQAILTASNRGKVRSLTWIDLEKNPDYFATESSC